VQRVELLSRARAALNKNATVLQKRAVSSRVNRVNGLVKDRIEYELQNEFQSMAEDDLDAFIRRRLLSDLAMMS
jgi:hypothetical protein